METSKTIRCAPITFGNMRRWGFWIDGLYQGSAPTKRQALARARKMLAAMDKARARKMLAAMDNARRAGPVRS